ncbi:hypothetical protein OCK74_03410 [Chitinophagaceae bacterium LB-8]|uniref:Uncharacterized protein n=1 Tax=Paraflavisolibacter caeni TaxID=2982496 RepID=A0A9X2XTG1_9BACT|nr:hypothetical protein [Paraflavisolibacter caeni]MCU7548142.1 hypothetical protein [Paraflavisolibacter caeni]
MPTPFAFIKHPAITGNALIKNVEYPFNLYRVYTFEDQKAFENFIRKYNLSNSCAIVDDYFIVISFIGTINDLKEKPVDGKTIDETVLQSFAAVKQFYQQNRLKGNESRLKKYKITTGKTV